MVFSSVSFLFLFLPLFLAVYFLTPSRFRSYTIVAGSYLFYSWWRVDFAILIMAVTLFNFGISKAMTRTKTPNKKLLAFGVAGNLLNLGYFKYFNFGVDSLNALLGNENAITAWHVLMPIGISFYTFQVISYLIDCYRGDVKPSKRFIDFAAFVCLFPQLISGPILRYKDIAPQIEKRDHTMEKFNCGTLRFATGFCKKIFIADTLSSLANSLFNLPEPTMAEAWLGAITYTAQLYFDFSGYTDMAVGVALMMGFKYPENFNYPYLSKNITEFWNRWHMTLGSFLRDYLYIPLGGNRKGRVRTYINLAITMLLSGLWHGANWTFILWGALHGLVMTLERFLTDGKKGSAYPTWLAQPLTILLLLIFWVTFRATNIDQAFTMYQGMIGQNGISISDNSLWFISKLHITTLFVAWFIMLICPKILTPKREEKNIQGAWLNTASTSTQLAIIVLFTMAACKLIGASFAPFLYFDF